VFCQKGVRKSFFHGIWQSDRIFKNFPATLAGKFRNNLATVVGKFACYTDILLGCCLTALSRLVTLRIAHSVRRKTALGGVKITKLAVLSKYFSKNLAKSEKWLC
jgi:hypothetical protein